MPGRIERPHRGAAWILALLLLACLAGGGARAQDEDQTERAETWASFASNAETIVGNPDTPTEELESLRERLVAQRSDALAAEQQQQPAVNELDQRLQALGPPPAEGASEAPEIATLRHQLNSKIADAKAPVLSAQEAYRRTDTLIVAIDRTVRGRFSAELMARSPSPLRPSAWTGAVAEIRDRLTDYTAAIHKEFNDPATRSQVMRNLPINLALVVAGLAIAFTVRRWLIEWVERRLEHSSDRRLVAWLVALRNLTRLVVPAVGAGLFFAAFDPGGLLARADQGRFFALPPFVLVLIAAGWLAGSLMAPAHRAFRLIPLEDDEAWQATQVVLVLGFVVSLWLLFTGLSVRWDLSTSTQSVLQYPLVLVGAAALWRASALIKVARSRLVTLMSGDQLDSATVTIGLRFLYMLTRVLRLIAIAAPLLGAVGYLPAASFLVFRTAMTLGLLGGVRVLFDLLNKTAQVFFGGPATPSRSDDGGLTPVVVAAIVGLAGLPVLAMVWGARPSDIADFWTTMREGVTFGGIRLSASAVITLVLVFAFGLGLTRLLQSLLRGTVLPRTRLDAGGRNAVLAGVGYLGVGIAGISAVAAAGLNLSSLAIVAGALSVGIGFGMQNIVSNFVSGIILLVERPVKEGDWIEVGGFSGYVRGINVRSTEIETFDRASVILPNSDLIAGTVLNRTHKGRSGRLQVPVAVTYDADPRKVEAILLDIAEQHPLVLEDPAPRVLFLELGPDSMNFELRCWLRDVNFSLSAKSDMNFDIIAQFGAAGIRVRFYGRDLPDAPPPEPPAVSMERKKES